MNLKPYVATITCVGLLASAYQALAAEPRRLTLTEAVQLALSQNRELKIARLKVVQNEYKKAGAKASYFPEIKNESNFLHTTALENIQIPSGAFGQIPNAGLVPNHNILIDQGNQTFVTSGTGLTQPLTQLIRIRQSNRIATSEIAASRDEVKKAENRVAVTVHQLYYAILVTGLQKRAADQETTYAETRLRESEDDVRNGSALKIASIEGRAGLLQSKQNSLTAALQLSDLTTELNDLLGLPLDTPLELSPVQPARLEEHPRDEYLKLAFAENPQILAAMETVEQAKARRDRG